MRAKLEGIAKTVLHVSESQKKAIVKLARKGLCNPCIAREVGLGDRHSVARWRGRAGCPSSVGQIQCCRCKERTAEKTRRQCRDAGVRSLAEIRSLAFAKFAIDNGWPEDLRPREVQILNVLADRGVPMSRLELAEAIGMRTDRMASRGTLVLLVGNGPGGTYTASLMRRGLLLKLKRGARVHGQGKGRSRDLYCLGPAAIAILEARACPRKKASST